MYLKLHPTPNGSIAALCDANLIGTVLFDKKRHLDLQKYAGFYSGKKVDAGEAVAALREAASVNLVGKKSLSAAKKAGLNVKGSVMIAGVPHLQIYKL